MATRQRILRKHSKGQDDHVDAWLMSYADMITLLCMMFVIFISFSIAKQSDNTAVTRGEPEHPYVKEHSGFLNLGTNHDEIYRNLTGVVISNSADQHIALEKMKNGILVDLSALTFFKEGTAEIPSEEMPLLKVIASMLKDGILPNDLIEVEGYTDDELPEKSPYANNWQLSAMRATRIVELLLESGVDPDKLRAISYASNYPLVPNLDIKGNSIIENKQRNQRVIIRVKAIEEKRPASNEATLAQQIPPSEPVLQ